MALLDVDDGLDDETTCCLFLLFLCLSSTLCLFPLCCLVEAKGVLHLVGGVEEDWLELLLSLDKDEAFLYWINILCAVINCIYNDVWQL